MRSFHVSRPFFGVIDVSSNPVLIYAYLFICRGFIGWYNLTQGRMSKRSFIFGAEEDEA